MKKRAVSMIRGLGRRLVGVLPSTETNELNLSHAPLGMLDVERITRVAPPIASITTRPPPSRASSAW